VFSRGRIGGPRGFAEACAGGFPGEVVRRQADGSAARFPDDAKWHGIGGISVLKPGLACFGPAARYPASAFSSERDSRESSEQDVGQGLTT